MGSGKSSIGKKLARALDFEFEDLDSEIEKIEEKTIPQLFFGKRRNLFQKEREQYPKRTFITATQPCFGHGGRHSVLWRFTCVFVGAGRCGDRLFKKFAPNAFR
jgi:shikimate kinase